MHLLILNPSQIITVNTKGIGYKRGNELNNIETIEDHSLIIENNLIKDFIPNTSVKKNQFDLIIDAKDNIVMPGLVECHTHLVFSGSRADEFKQKLEGVSYEDISRSGGGINKTVNSVRETSFTKLFNIASKRVQHFIEQGVTTLEIKSGYGLDFENEIKLLKVINQLNKKFPIDIHSTFLGAHTIPKEFSNNRNGYIDLIINEMLPAINKEKLATACDAFCESTAFAKNEVDLIFNKAIELGLRCKLHTDQFNSIGGIDTALKNNAISVDHLEVITDDDISKFSDIDMVCVILPGVSYFLNHKYSPVKKLIDKNAIIALATDFNPGSSNISNISFIMSLAALKLGMSIEQIISAYTINSAKALNLSDKIGSLEIGKQADLSIYDTDNYADLIYQTTENLNIKTIKNGKVIFDKNGV
ncbi:MAG: imidazolonepropionase [Bacteroidetes bacterium]|nr:imidazolonepropionase [Bacteroidota bacterium]